MAIGIIVAIILIGLFIGFVIGVGKCSDSYFTTGTVICAILAIISAISILVVPFSFHTVESGERAVVKTLGKITGTRDAGTNFDLWFTTSYMKYDTKVQNVDIATAAYSSDAQTMDVAMTLQYKVVSDKVVDIATQYGTLDVLQSRIQSIVVEKTKAVLSAHKAMDIIANRATISPEVEAAVKAAVDEGYYISVEAVVLTNIDFSDSFEKAVEDKMIAEQAKLKADYDAEALMIAAEAQAEANKLLTQSLTEQVLESMFYDKWNGELPQVMGDGAAILDIREDE